MQFQWRSITFRMAEVSLTVNDDEFVSRASRLLISPNWRNVYLLPNECSVPTKWNLQISAKVSFSYRLPSSCSSPFFSEIRKKNSVFFTFFCITFAKYCTLIFFSNSFYRCPRDTTVDYSYYPTRSFQQLKIKTFRFFNDYDAVFVHCELFACHNTSNNSRWALPDTGRILLKYWCKCYNLIGLAIAHYLPLACSG